MRFFIFSFFPFFFFARKTARPFNLAPESRANQIRKITGPELQIREIPNPEFQIREIRDRKQPIGDPHLREISLGIGEMKQG